MKRKICVWAYLLLTTLRMWHDRLKNRYFGYCLWFVCSLWDSERNHFSFTLCLARGEPMHRSLLIDLPKDASAISDCLKNQLSLGSERVPSLLFHFKNVTAALIHVVTAHYTSEFLHSSLLHPEWCSYNLLVIFLLPECISIVIHLMKLAIE